MKYRRPGVIASRAVNQYRRRDIVAFLGVRHLLKNTATQSDLWAQKVAAEVVRNRTVPAYFLSHHFKDIDSSGRVTARQIAIPSPVEILAETALLAECSGLREFSSPHCVFTYQLAKSGDRSGSFVNYSEGLRNRHRAIADACAKAPNGIVRYLDIRKFYPSIRSEDALRAWLDASAGLGQEWRDLGSKILADHAAASGNSGNGLLTGPMFSHLIANLVMKEVDDWASKSVGVAYFRYVDDITLVGSKDDVDRAEIAIANRLGRLNLELHDDNSSKSVRVSVDEWMSGRLDFEDDANDTSWMRLIGNLKSFLVLHPDKRDDLHRAFIGAGMKMPVLDYSTAAHEHSFTSSVWTLLQRPWYRIKSSGISISSIIGTADKLKLRFQDELGPLLDSLDSSSGFQRKRLIPKVRYRTGRLVYLAEDVALRRFWDLAENSTELQMQCEVSKAAATGDVSTVLSMGSNAVQSAAQPLRAVQRAVTYKVASLTEVELQGLAVLNFNGLSVHRAGGEVGLSSSAELLRVAEDAVDLQMMKSIDPFVREIACLAGVGSTDHSALVESAFDEADEFVLDAVERLQESFPQ